jgi:predicted RNase H-like HicB family nuclease
MKTTLLRYHVIIQSIPTLGISDFGKTVTRAKQNIAKAIACHIEGLVKTDSL